MSNEASAPTFRNALAISLALSFLAFPQTPPAGQSLTPQSGQPQPSAPGAPVNLTLQDALQRAAQYSQQVYTANFGARLAHEDAVQARAALLPTLNGFSQFIYTQSNGSPSGVFVANDGPHVYVDQAQVHARPWQRKPWPAPKPTWRRVD